MYGYYVESTVRKDFQKRPYLSKGKCPDFRQNL